ncbi:MAG: hypothetical protein AABZ53_06740, partial [Planctomycetota bacterium]
MPGPCDATLAGTNAVERESRRANARREYDIAVKKLQRWNRELSGRETLGVVAVLVLLTPIALLFEHHYTRTAIGLTTAVAVLAAVAGQASRWLLVAIACALVVFGALNSLPGWLACPALAVLLLVLLWAGAWGSQRTTEARALAKYDVESFDKRDHWPSLRLDLERGTPVVMVLWTFSGGDPSPEEYDEVGNSLVAFGARYDNPLAEVING